MELGSPCVGQGPPVLLCRGCHCSMIMSVVKCSMRMSVYERTDVDIREQSRIGVLNGVMEGKVLVEEAARLMGVSERHAWRLLRAISKGGSCWSGSRNRGRRPSTTTCPEIQEKVMELATGPYSGFNHSHLTEMLADREGIHLSRSTVRRVLLAGENRKPSSSRAPKRYLRRSATQEGMLLQIDGSRHNWLEGRGPHLTLIGSVDDATGTVPFALSVSRRTPTATC